jgi:polyisoprenoid-binding protein YceI
MKHVFFSFLALLAFPTIYLSAQTIKWTTDKNHTSVKFEVQHLGISIVAGQFMEFEGSMVSDKEDFSDAKISFTIQTKSVNTNVEMRDNDLRSDNFFDAIQYPEMTFKSTGFMKQSDSTYALNGYLTIKDVTEQVDFNVIYNKTITDPWGNTRTGFRADLTINRFHYHINNKDKFGNNVLHVAPDVKIIIDTELIKTK